MRQIKFRGKRLDNNKWIVGSLIRIVDLIFIIPDPAPDEFDRYVVDPATVGQFTGLLDKNGKEIYEGDMLQMWLEDAVEPSGGLWHRMYVVFTTEKGFVLWGERMILEDAEPLHQTLQWKECEIIGNSYDNLE